MSLYARLVNNVVVEIVNLPTGVTPSQAFHSSLTFQPCDSTVVQGDVWNGSSFAAAPAPTYTTAQLTQWASALRDKIVNGGITVNVGTTQAPINVSADTTADGRANLMGILQGYALGVLTGNYTWYQSSGSVSLTLTQLQQVAVAVMGFVANCFATWQAVVNAININTIATPAQVETPPSPIPAWPVNS